ncbi:carbohydrate-binding domain-containing protein [Paenibacillus ginsengarvi]|uniref:Carbohydrate-binding domain-containing protein n=1 Tax=Paenibacillus ginsengarvi TaxID=400777 RepID=A0A3B0BU09_9BACL|nr:carbohydrate-binding domain-containing protein [Paenibacillus ginsengarvi]RKN75868.1 carbohydrate-binding domain-containing protein [Paenibacillus ginsengarvi]
MKHTYKAKAITYMLVSALLAAGCSSNGDTSALGGASAAGSSDAASAVKAEGTHAAAEVKQANMNAAELAGFKENDALTAWDAGSSTSIVLKAEGASINGSGASVEGGVVKIVSAGTYVVSGTASNGQIMIDVPKDAVVHLVLNGVQITKDDGPALYVKKADKTIVTLQDGTDNLLSDGKVYADTSEDAPTAALFSKGDLTINGAGKLSVRGNANDGITSKDDLKIMSGTIDVQAADDGMIGRDLFAVKGGSIAIKAGGDGIKTTNDTETDNGRVVIAGGTFRIESVNDGIQAASSALIGGGDFEIVSGGGSGASTKTHQEQMPGGGGFGRPPQDQNRGGAAATQASAAETPSAKALKATADIAFADGQFRIDAADDAIHSNAGIVLAGGQFNLSSGDDAIHADASITISGGTIEIVKSYEGIESTNITIAGGDIRLASSDDGINVSGGNDSSASAGSGKSGDRFSATSGLLTISGGTVYVDAAGDGLDSNGSIVMSGGTVIVNGPTTDGNGALDYDGTFKQSGGFLIAAGSAGMAQAPSEDSTQRAVLMTFPSSLAAGTLVTLTDSSGTALATFAPAKTFRSVVVSSPELKAGETYTISTGGKSTGTAKNGLYEGGSTSGSTKLVTFTLGDKVTYVNQSGVTTVNSGGGPGGGGRGPGGGFGQGRR